MDSEAVVRRWSVKIVFLEISQNSQQSTYAEVSFLINVFSLAQVFSCGFCEISKSNFFTERLRAPPPLILSFDFKDLILIKIIAWDLQLYLKRDSGTGVFLWILQDF